MKMNGKTRKRFRDHRLSVGMLSLGCPKTLVDSELVLGGLNAQKYRVAEQITECDIALVNTCAFIEDAKEESIDHILRLAELKRSGNVKALVVLGCLVQRYEKELSKALHEVDAFIGTGDYRELGTVLDAVVHKKRISKVGREPGFLYTADMNRFALTPRYTRYLKISEGCDHICTFCTIPTFRGRHRSRAMEDVVREASLLVESGAKELVLTGQDTSYYGRDLNGKYTLPELLRRLNQMKGLRWIRILYAYPSCVTDELIDAMSGLDKVCHYLDMPLQHVSDPILRAMKRGTTKQTTAQLIEKLRNRIPDLAIRTTFIVGFPGETDDDFEQLISFMKEVKFERLGLFQYSQEDGSEAASYGKQIPDDIKAARYEEGMVVQQWIARENNAKLIRQVLTVLVEGKEEQGGRYVGRSYQDAPEVDGAVYVSLPSDCGHKLQPGDFVLARIKETEAYDLHAAFLKQDNG